MTEESESQEKRVVIIIPTMGSPDLIVPCVNRVLFNRVGWNTHIIVVCNTTEEAQDDAAFAKHQVLSEVKVISQVEAENANGVGALDVTCNWLDLDQPAGWPGAVNIGVQTAIEMFEDLPDHVVVMNDDVLVTPQWLDGLSSALWTRDLLMSGDPEFAQKGTQMMGQTLPSQSRGVGIVGPCTNNASSMQKVMPPPVEMASSKSFTIQSYEILEKWSLDYKRENYGAVLNSSVLSGFLMMYSKDCLLDLVVEGVDGKVWLLDPIFGIGGHDDNDVCARAEIAGWSRAIALDTYVHHLGHQTLDIRHPECERGGYNIHTYLTKWNSYTSRDQKMMATYRVRLHTMQDLMLFRNSVQRCAGLLDGVAVLMTGNPSVITKSYDFQDQVLGPPDRVLLDQCSNAKNTEEIRLSVEAWLTQAVKEVSPDGVKVCAGIWSGEWNERDERNAAIELVESLDPDWIISVDHDEIIENRVQRKHLDRLMNHPDPNVQIYDIGWLNHWDTDRLCRTDPPWCSADYSSSMRGFRIWRHRRSSPHRIVLGNEIGLHCGNSPDHGVLGKRVSGIRMRHYGYLRPADRQRKYQMYSQLDPSPRADMTTGGVGKGGYRHLVAEENMRLSPYSAADGIGYFMLAYKDEQSYAIASVLTHLYALVDHMVIVWTGPEGSEVPERLKTVGDAYGVQWVHQPFTGDLSECRNAGMDALRGLCREGVSWALSMDDDEVFESPFQAAVAMRRMAEVNDSWGWMFRFKNYREDGNWQWSETQRMVRIEPSSLTYFSGRVHETVEKSNREMIAKGIFPEIRFAPFSVLHFGLASDAETMQKKLVNYSAMLVDDIKARPDECAPWVSLALQYGNDQREEEMIQCLKRACDLAGGAYLPWKELGTVMMRRGKRLFEQSHQRLAPSHPYYEAQSQILKWLHKLFPDQPLSGHASEEHSAIPDDLILEDLLSLTKSVQEGVEEGGSSTENNSTMVT